MKDEYFMKEALKEAKIALMDGNFPIGCVIVLNGTIIARAHNEVYSSKNRFAHAEKLALDRCKNILWDSRNEKKAILYTTFEPCIMCLGMSVVSRIKKIVWGTNIDNSGCCEVISKLPPFYKNKRYKLEIIGNFLEKECSKIYLQGVPVKKMIKEGIMKK